MAFQRGDVVIVRFPFSSGQGAKIRPALIVQNDADNRRLTNVIVAAITTTTHRSARPTQLLLELSTPDGMQAGLAHDSVVTCENLATIERVLVRKKIGSLSETMMKAIDNCLKTSLGIA